VFPLLAPVVFEIARLTRNKGMLQFSGRLDNLHVRTFLSEIHDAGWDPQEARKFAMVPQFLSCLKSDATSVVKEVFSHSQSQILQDIFVLLCSNKKRDGYFIEAGVGDGRFLSNTYMLEKLYNWRGILAEPNLDFINAIQKHRSAILDTRAVFSKSGLQMDFLADEKIGELSTLVNFVDDDAHHRSGRTYRVDTITLNDLLMEHKSPEIIDYVSIDTEGSEFEILKGLDLRRYQVNVFTIEINRNKKKFQNISNLLTPFGYRLVLPQFSAIDSWFVHPDAGSNYC
jgi:FkbM family methyltransferase